MDHDSVATAAERSDPVMTDFFDTAADRGFPLFLGHEAASNALNATPYVTGYTEFTKRLSTWPGRPALLESMDRIRYEADHHARIVGILIGGSFLDPTRQTPRDLDLLMLYEARDGDRGESASRLIELRRRARTLDIDVRFIPIDSDPLMLVKIVSYFTTLFNRRKGMDVQVRGLVLLDCRALSRV